MLELTRSVGAVLAVPPVGPKRDVGVIDESRLSTRRTLRRGMLDVNRHGQSRHERPPPAYHVGTSERAAASHLTDLQPARRCLGFTLCSGCNSTGCNRSLL